MSRTARGLALACALAALAWATLGAAQTELAGVLRRYQAGDLAQLCLQGDNASREGLAAQRECEQYVGGFLDALAVASESAAPGAVPAICFPAEIDPIDAVRRAFTRWVFAHYSERDQPAGVQLWRMLGEEFGCG